MGRKPFLGQYETSTSRPLSFRVNRRVGLNLAEKLHNSKYINPFVSIVLPASLHDFNQLSFNVATSSVTRVDERAFCIIDLGLQNAIFLSTSGVSQFPTCTRNKFRNCYLHKLLSHAQYHKTVSTPLAVVAENRTLSQSLPKPNNKSAKAYSRKRRSYQRVNTISVTEDVDGLVKGSTRNLLRCSVLQSMSL